MDLVRIGRIMRRADPNLPDLDTADLRRLGSRIVKLRSSRGWKQVELSRRTGIEPPRLSRIEKGRTTPTLEELVRLRRALEADLEELVFGGRPPSPAGTLRELAAEIDPEGGVRDLNVLETLLRYLVAGYQAEHGERAGY